VLNLSCLIRAGLVLVALSCAGLQPDPAHAQAPSAAGPGVLKSEVYFGLRKPDGSLVDEQAWQTFVTEVVVPRFPAGLTVLEGAGRSGGSPERLNPTRILIVVHPAGEDAQSRMREIKAEYRKRFGGAGIFHTDQPVRIHPGD